MGGQNKSLLRSVLKASVFVQLIGFTILISTQVVIDKVVVQRTESTLIAIAAGLPVDAVEAISKKRAINMQVVEKAQS